METPAHAEPEIEELPPQFEQTPRAQVLEQRVSAFSFYF